MDTSNTELHHAPAREEFSKDIDTALSTMKLNPAATILDVGTGQGKFAISMAQRGFQVVTGEPSTDVSVYAGHDWESAAEKAGVRNQIRFEAFDASCMPFDDNHFDAVCFFGVLHHIEETLRTSACREAVRAVKQDGVVVFFEPTTETLRQLWLQDVDHPFAADPRDYLIDNTMSVTALKGVLMDITIFRREA